MGRAIPADAEPLQLVVDALLADAKSPCGFGLVAGRGPKRIENGLLPQGQRAL